jgi:small subunit ribosomal protein S9
VHTDVECPQEEDWPPEEIQKWEFGRRKLATLMGAEESFSEKEVEEALCYLMPTKLTARDTRPLMKHPSKIFDKRKESAFDASGRPLEPAFYTGFPAYYNLVYEIYRVSLELESEKRGEREVKEETGRGRKPKLWVKRRVMANILAEEISKQQHQELVSRLSRLASNPKAAAVSNFLDQFRRPHFSHSSSSTYPETNSRGQVRSVGRRKSSVAVVHLSPGEGEVTVNSEPLLSYFPLVEHRQQVLFPLVLTELLGGVTLTSQVRGGGKTGQAGAIRLALSKALMGLPGEHQPVLEGAGLLVRDHRAVERKKPGQKKARKKFSWSVTPSPIMLLCALFHLYATQGQEIRDKIHQVCTTHVVVVCQVLNGCMGLAKNRAHSLGGSVWLLPRHTCHCLC